MASIDNFFDTDGEPASQSNKKDGGGWNRRISWSQFKTYQECPKKWELKYKDGHYVPSDSINTIFGVSIHETIQTFLDVLYNESVKKAESLDLHQILIDKMKEEFVKAKETFEESKFKLEEDAPANRFEMKKFLMDGKKILKSFLSNRTDYFNTHKTELVGIELQIDHSIKENVDYVGYLDVVLKNKGEDTYKIIDIKTSKEGWDKWKKKDKMRVNQVVSYKSYYADVLDTDPSNIEVEYIILKREVNQNSIYPQSRIQTFSPPSGSITQNKVRTQINEFIEDCYNEDGSRKDGEYEKQPEKFKCCWCEFSQQFNGSHPVCDQDGERFGVDEDDKYPPGMKGYIDDKYIANE